MKKLPKLCRFKARNLAFVHIDGGKRKLYLGKRGAPETEAAYRRIGRRRIDGERGLTSTR